MKQDIMGKMQIKYVMMKQQEVKRVRKFLILCISCLVMITFGACEKTVDADAYREIYKQKVTDFTEDTVVFSLIYVDDDDIPELAVHDAGYDTYSIYTIKDDALFCIVDSMSTVQLTCFERSGTIAAFASWNGGGDEGSYSLSYYQTTKDKTLTNDTQPTLNCIYNAVYDEDGNYTGEGITDYYYMGEATDDVTFQEVLGNLGITEKSKTICAEDTFGKEEITQLLSQ